LDGEENLDATYNGPQCTSSDFIQLAEQLLAFHSYYSQKTEFWKQGDQNGERNLHKAMAVMLTQLTSTLSRDGNGWNTAKVHSTFRHVAKLISLYGRPTNCDSEVGERGLKTWAKKPAKVTNKGSAADFLRQVTLRYYESHLFATGAKAHGCSQPGTTHNPKDKDNQPVGMVGNRKFRVTYDGSRKNEQNVTCSITRSQWCGPSVQPPAITSILSPIEITSRARLGMGIG
jgi:hypothetical protein